MKAVNPVSNEQLIEVFKTSYGALYQDDKNYCFYLHFESKWYSFKVKCLQAFKTQIFDIDLGQMVYDPHSSSDFEIITPCNCEHCFVLTISQVIQLREILEGTSVMLQLNSILHEKVYSIAV